MGSRKRDSIKVKEISRMSAKRSPKMTALQQAEKETIQTKAGRTATEGTDDYRTNGTGKFMWQIWPCGKLCWKPFYGAAGGYRKTLPDETNQMKKQGMENKRLHMKMKS